MDFSNNKKLTKGKNPSLNEIWGKVPVDYYQKGTKINLFQKSWHYLKIRSTKTIIKQLNFQNCLDIGCASGYMLSRIAHSYPHAKYYGVDVYKKAIDYAKKKYPTINFRVSYAEKLPFANDSFDLITFYETIEHVENPLVALKEIKRVLKNNGIAVIAMDSGSLLFRIVWLVWENSKGKVWKGAHLHPFHHTELEKIIKKAGLKIRGKKFTHIGMEVSFVVTK